MSISLAVSIIRQNIVIYLPSSKSWKLRCDSISDEARNRYAMRNLLVESKLAQLGRKRQKWQHCVGTTGTCRFYGLGDLLVAQPKHHRKYDVLTQGSHLVSSLCSTTTGFTALFTWLCAAMKWWVWISDSLITYLCFIYSSYAPVTVKHAYDDTIVFH